MPRAQSINQNPLPDALPNSRNLGVVLRLVLIINVAALLLALARANTWGEIGERWLTSAALLEPTLLTTLLVLYGLQPKLDTLAYRSGAALVATLSCSITALIYLLGMPVYTPSGEGALFNAIRYATLAGLSSLGLLAYFRLRRFALSPARHQARLQALRARIRPHFLFNTLNAVLAIVRSQPKRAEEALEDLSDLFRMAMEDAADLVPLRREIELARRYLALEQLRLGDRLQLDWGVQAEAETALIPPLLLQPLLENAVYHGIERLPQGGLVTIRIERNHRDLSIAISNPHPPKSDDVPGHRLALNNIRERLALLYDLEAHYQVQADHAEYRVRITLPYQEDLP
ncbi:Sensor histidine kinase YpdA [Ferriphaselus amnicola]|uniref:Sensor histidine kinase YpdA n=1 Tax=Ferriphaselus amnicola TaxID=1188319 RepID=A0A2Z6GEM4_9PROT|nr:histidine kinase [Ferriphaselus amnicola]BBE52083.1 Sensor histidine kinase YpdA [Ferriphaselus amnicola]